jgi:hypothetical protein
LNNNNNKVASLIQIRDSFGKDPAFAATFRWSDSDPQWSTKNWGTAAGYWTYQSQANQVNDVNDGIFFMRIEDLVNNFDYLSVSYYNPSW